MIKLSSKVLFFDSAVVVRRVGAAQRRVLSRFGAFVRTRARSSIRNRKKTSPAGSPPYGKTGLLRRFLFFAYDLVTSSVVIGPQRITGVRDPGAPERLEYGGALNGDGREIWVSNAVGRDKKTGRFLSGGKQKITLTGKIKYPARPYMGPAMNAELPGLQGLWRNSVR